MFLEMWVPIIECKELSTENENITNLEKLFGGKYVSGRKSNGRID